jgi:hypothetical protein
MKNKPGTDENNNTKGIVPICRKGEYSPNIFQGFVS